MQLWPRMIWLLVLLGCSLPACNEDVKPRSLEEIEAERMALPALFITTSGKPIQAPANLGLFVDEASREIAWPAYACDNPQCPARKPDGQPHLFTWQDPRFFVTPEGKLGTREFATLNAWREAVAQAGGFREPTCPECFKNRRPATETPQDREKFNNYVRRYDPPESIARRKELDAQWQERKSYIEQRIRSAN